jgi:hypothetical protein
MTTATAIPQPAPFPTPTARVERYDDPELGQGWRVDTLWPIEGLDRPHTHGYVLGNNSRLADRLSRAIEDGAVYENPRIVRDVDGRTYVQAHAKVMGKYANADLRRLGY